MAPGPGGELRAAGGLWGPPARALRQRFGRRFSTALGTPPANVVVAWCRSEKPNAGDGSDGWVAQFSCRLHRHQPQVVADDNLGAISSPKEALSNKLKQPLLHSICL